MTAAHSARASAIATTDLPDLVEKILPGVVNVSSVKIQRTTVYGLDDFFQLWGIPKEQPQTSLGSGFILSKDGFVITNNHVVDDADEVIITLLNRKSYRAKLIGKDPKMDIALLKIRDKNGNVPTDLSPVPLGDSSKTRIAEPVFAVGNPFGLQHTVTTGIVSAKNRTIGVGPLDDFLQTDASINPGNSGGPLFNFKGEVVGINTLIFSRTQQSAGVGFAIPVNEAKDILDDLKKYGRVPRPWLGMLGQRMTPQLQAYYDLPTDTGVVVANLVASGPADKSGLRQGDIIVAVSDVAVVEPGEVERELYKRKPKDMLALKVKRGSKTLDLNVKLDELPRRIRELPQGVF